MNIILLFSIVFLSVVVLFFIFNARTTKIHHISKMHTTHATGKTSSLPEPHCHPWGCGKISNIVPKKVEQTLSKIKTKSLPPSKINRNASSFTHRVVARVLPGPTPDGPPTPPKPKPLSDCKCCSVKSCTIRTDPYEEQKEDAECTYDDVLGLW